MRWSWSWASSRSSGSRSKISRLAARRWPRWTRSPTSSPPSEPASSDATRRSLLVSVSESLPQRYPFRLVEQVRGERVVALLTVDGHWLRDAPALPPALALEMMAQAAHLLLAEDAGAAVFLAGIDGAE